MLLHAFSTGIGDGDGIRSANNREVGGRGVSIPVMHSDCICVLSCQYQRHLHGTVLVEELQGDVLTKAAPFRRVEGLHVVSVPQETGLPTLTELEPEVMRGGILSQAQPASALGLKRASMVVPWWSRLGQGLPPR